MHTRSIPVWLIAVLFIAAGTFHFLNPAPYIAMMPSYLPWPASLVALSGIAEIAGGVGMLVASLRVPAAWCLIALLLAVLPANLHVALHGWPNVNIPPWVLWLRLPLQPVFAWLVYRFCIAKSRHRPESSDEPIA